MFDAVDTSNDRRIELEEFHLAVPLLASWGVPVADPAEEFKKIDTNKGGYLLFDEFSAWALQHGLDKDVTDNVAGEDGLANQHKMARETVEASKKETDARVAAMKKRESNKGFTNENDLTAGINLRKLTAKLPAGASLEHQQRRMALFKSFDINQNGCLSLHEIEIGLRQMLGIAPSHALAPAITRAYHAAKEVKQAKGAKVDPTVGHEEFRMLLVYLKRYSELLQMFDAVDTSDDRRIEMREFVMATPLFAEWGVTVANPAEEFRKIDTNKGCLLYTSPSPRD